MLPEYREIIAQHFDQSATARTTLTALTAKYPECLLLNRDIYNEWQSLRKAQLRGRTPMEFLFDTLRAENSTFSIKLDRNNRCSQLLLLPQQTKELSREFGQVIQLDSTYNTNRYKVPLLHFVGSTNTDNTFTVAICFMTSETTGDYLWGLSEFKRLSGIDISPNVIVTDREPALINAIKIVYPRATHVLCSWHIEKNILSSCKKYFPTKFQVGESAFAYLVTWDDFLVSWSRLISEIFDVEEFNSTWTAIKQQIPIPASEYIWFNWLLPWKERFCAPYLQNTMHFGNLTTSRAEGTHAALKSWMRNSNLNLLGAYHAIKRHVDNQVATCIIERERQKDHRLVELLSFPVFDEVQTVISHPALKKTYAQFSSASNAQTPIGLCSHQMEMCLGIPCAHVIRRLLEDRAPFDAPARLQAHHFNRYWLLDQTLVAPAEPLVRSPRLPSRRSINSRVQSKFEVVEAELHRERGLKKCGCCNQYVRHNRRTCPLRPSNTQH